MKDEGGRHGHLRIPVRDGSVEGPVHVDRRTMLKLMGASLALAAGLPGCVRKPPRQVVSRESAPEWRKPGQPVLYSSTWLSGPHPYGMVVKTLEGRPVKIEGNPDHPLNGGASSAAMQATLLSLYDPDRLRAPRGAPSWDAADARIREALATAASVVVLTRATLGPSEREVLAAFLARHAAARHLAYEALDDRDRRGAWQALYGADGQWIPRFDRARVVLSVGSDFLATDGVELEAVRRFAAGRVPAQGADGTGAAVSRLYVAEGEVSLTGTNADHRLPLRPSRAAAFVAAVRALVVGGDPDRAATSTGLPRAILAALAADLRAHPGEALVVAGAAHPAPVHAAVALLNEELGAPGRTLEWNPRPAALVPAPREDIAAALAGGVDVLLCLGADPAYDWPAFRDLAGRARLSVAHALHPTDTAALCTLALPSHHDLESWGDAEPQAGVLSLAQPVVQPLYDTRQEAESLLSWTAPAAAGTAPHTRFRDVVRSRALAGPLAGVPGPAVAWEQALQRGVVAIPAPEAPPPALDRVRAEALAAKATPAGGALELVLMPHATTWDGRFATNPWLLEVPDPVTKLMWDNAALVGEATAATLSVRTGDVVRLTVGSASVELPVLVLPGVAPGVVAVTPGLGRPVAGDPALAAGVNAWALAVDGRRLQPDVGLAKTGRTSLPVLSQPTFSMEGRPIVLDTTADGYAGDPDAVRRRRPKASDDTLLYPSQVPAQGYKWAMAIDLARCVGCNACVVACQSENNIPVVGREQCANGREMHWLRIDQYREGTGDDVKVHHQPMPCQHCDNAPCETVCPVNATSHSPEGLNDMAYNRCIGTRYCANNCPFKVRRFNFFNWQKRALRDPVQRLVHNPDVTVRQVGVMEKCTFCVQRINAAKFKAANANRPLADGEVVPACAQACPAGAITFGDARLDAGGKGSAVAGLAASSRAFRVLEELRVEPAVTYLARVRNPAGAAGAPPAGGEGAG